MSRPEDGFGRYWLGLHLFTEVSIAQQALNGLGHWALGLPFAAIVASLHQWVWDGLPLGFVLVAGPLPNLLRELVQFVRSGSPHLLDRLRDAFEGGLGAFTIYAVFRWAPPAG